MKKAPKKKRDPDLLEEYDFSNGVRGKYAKRYAEGTNVVVLAPDVAAVFRDSESVLYLVLAINVHYQALKQETARQGHPGILKRRQLGKRRRVYRVEDGPGWARHKAVPAGT